MYLMQIARKGIISVQLSKELGIFQRSAWFLLHRLREAMASEDVKLKGEVEIDETYVGGLEKNNHSNKKLRPKGGIGGKQAILGMRERDGAIIVWLVHNVQKKTLEDDILFYVEEGSTIYTDEHPGYADLENWFSHKIVNHKKGEYVNEDATTNSIESVWAVMKRGHKGVYHQWIREQGHRNVNEYVFRLVEGNVRNHIMVRIKHLVRKSIGVRLTYREMIGRPQGD